MEMPGAVAKKFPLPGPCPRARLTSAASRRIPTLGGTTARRGHGHEDRRMTSTTRPNPPRAIRFVGLVVAIRSAVRTPGGGLVSRRSTTNGSPHRAHFGASATLAGALCCWMCSVSGTRRDSLRPAGGEPRQDDHVVSARQQRRRLPGRAIFRYAPAFTLEGRSRRDLFKLRDGESCGDEVLH